MKGEALDNKIKKNVRETQRSKGVRGRLSSSKERPQAVCLPSSASAILVRSG